MGCLGEGKEHDLFEEQQEAIGAGEEGGRAGREAVPPAARPQGPDLVWTWPCTHSSIRSLWRL